MNSNSMIVNDNQVNTLYNTYPMEDLVNKDIKLRKNSHAFHIEEAQVYCLENDISSIEQLYRKDRDLYEDVVLACASSKYLDPLDLDSNKLVDYISSIHREGNENYSIYDLISYLTKEILKQTDRIAQMAIDQAWLDRDSLLEGRGE